MKFDRLRLWTVGAAAALLLAAALNVDRVLEIFLFVADITRPLAFGVLIALALDGPVDGFQKLLHPKGEGKSRTTAVVIAIAAVCTIAIGACYIVLPNLVQSVERLAARAPYYAAEITRSVEEFCRKIGIESKSGYSLLADDSIQNYASAVALTLMDIAGSLVRFSLAAVFAVYLLIRKEKICLFLDRVNRAFTSSPICAKIYRYTIDFARTFKRFVNGQVIEGIILGSLCFAGMLIIRLPYAALISVLIALTSLIPVIGAYIGAVPAVLLLLLENPIQALIFLVFLVALQQFEGSVIYPKVVGEAIGLDGLLVFAGVTLGAGIGGITGVVLGVPLTAVISRAVLSGIEKKEQETGKQ